MIPYLVFFVNIFCILEVCFDRPGLDKIDKMKYYHIENEIKFNRPRSISKRINYRKVKRMAYKISDACISCGACAAECPVSCISEGDGQYVIDADQCIECGNCANVCPVDAPAAE